MPLKQWPCKLTTADVVVQRKGRRRQKKTEEDEQKEREAEARRKRIARSLPLPSKLSGSGKLDKSDFDANVSAARLQESIQRETRLTWSMSSTLAVRMLVFEKGLLERCFCDQPEVSAVARSNFFVLRASRKCRYTFKSPSSSSTFSHHSRSPTSFSYRTRRRVMMLLGFPTWTYLPGHRADPGGA